MAGSPDKKEFLKGRMNIVDSLVMRIAEFNTHDVLYDIYTLGDNIHFSYFHVILTSLLILNVSQYL